MTREQLEEDEELSRAVASMKFIKCNYTKHARPEDFLYDSLSRGPKKSNRDPYDPYCFFWWFPCLPVFRCEALKNRHLQKGPFRPTIGCSEFNFFECPWCQPFPNTSPNTFPGLANRTAEKVKPSALDLLLLFKETVRLKQSVPGVKRSAIRDVLFACITDYNKTVSNHRAPWHKQVNDLDVS